MKDTEINEGGPAFPLAATPESIDYHGMSMRDWFAGQAPAVPDWFMKGERLELDRRCPSGYDGTQAEFDAWSADEVVFMLGRMSAWPWAYADAMLAARSTTCTPD